MKNIEDRILSAGAADAARRLIYDSDPKGSDEMFAALFVGAPELSPAISWFRAVGEQDGEALFGFLARRKALTVDEGAWVKLPDKTRDFFEIFARVAFALVKDGPRRSRAETRVVEAAPRRIEDTIFEKYRPLGEKIGREVSAGGQVSTAQVQVDHPAPGKQGDPFAAFGGKNPGEWSEAEKLAFADKMGMPSASAARDRIETAAPPAQKFKAKTVTGFSEGERVEGVVYVSAPGHDEDDDD